ncbi:uncharacterized protein LOC132622712 isoform X2 [Lycium barbarum]|uniref:uncharacterized protein LOC132622712 isoform X2 n=1 Tax=Lycium barbarum TaxID=112863 RepID=UPI00293F6E0E|nr:uncharacterized protein LOC132622712 isoform X2 [Lycium barbarum]
MVRADCGWDTRPVWVFAPGPNESITDHREGFFYVYTYPFTLKLDPPVILEMCRTYDMTLTQIGPIVWRVIACLRLLANNAGKELTLAHLIRLYSPRLFRGGVIKLAKRSRNPFFSKMDEDRDRGWLERYVRVKTEDIIPADYMPFPEEWNDKPNGCIPPVIRNLSEWVTALLSQHPHDNRTWGHLSRGRWVAQNHGLPKGSVVPRPESAAAPATSASEFDTAGSSRILADAAKRKRPSEKGQKPKKRARSVTRSLRDETEPDIIIRRVGATPSVAPIPEEAVSVPPLPSTGEGLLVPAPHSGETSSEDTPLQRTRRLGEAAAAEAEQRTEPASETEVPIEPATTTEPPAFAEDTEAAPSSSTPAPRVDEFEDMFSGTPPATGEAAGFGHLPIPRATRSASRTSESGARDRLVSIFPAPSVERIRTRSVTVTVPEDCSFLSRPVGVASYLRPLVSWQCLINEGMHAGNRSVVLVNEAFVRAQQEVDDLKGQLDAQGREMEKYLHLLREKEEELNRAAALSNLRPEIDAAKDENRQLKSELAAMADYNRSLEADKIGLSRDKTHFSSRLDELEITVSQHRGS